MISSRKAISQFDESDLIGKAQAVVVAAAAFHFHEIQICQGRNVVGHVFHTGGRCQLNVGQTILSRNTPQPCSSSADTRRLPPVGKSSVAKQSLMNCLEMVPTHPEQILNRTVDRKESLSLLD